MAPWKRRVAMSQANTQLARAHHRQSLLKRCILSWQQVTGESLAQKWASAKQLHQHILLRRSLGNWKRLKDHRMVVEGRADRFWRMHTLRRALIALLDHVTQERMVEWDREQQAQGHSDRRVVRSCFQAWRRYPGWLREERERETRREKLRRRVAEVLPDFRSSPLNCQWVQALL
ncbi:coiled-coil domain-containing protein 191-like [Oncorhynchus tshawytscha]|uniref:coiled-coil domain-containing protein 191-like n=1 Tax=Oncorhynchus tshawytscha TaxID=74940 RepID=UPI000D09C99C|nr:coiled-coil domain-containing protein 191-like [Oncorhynchus tshawytscha]